MKPERALLQNPEPEGAGNATLANGVKCGENFRRLARRGWPTFIDFTGRVLDKHVYVDTRREGNGEGYLLPEHDEVTRVMENSGTVRLGVAGRRILGFGINGKEPSKALLLLDAGTDPVNPRDQECMILATDWPLGSPRWVWDALLGDLITVTELKADDVINPTFLGVLKSWGLTP